MVLYVCLFVCPFVIFCRGLMSLLFCRQTRQEIRDSAKKYFYGYCITFEDCSSSGHLTNGFDKCM